jgi:hypothetical protein
MLSTAMGAVNVQEVSALSSNLLKRLEPDKQQAKRQFLPRWLVFLA